MDLYLLAELKTIALKVTTVNMSKPPKDFRSKFDSTMPPILIDGDEAVLDNEKIERHIMKNIPGGHNLFVSDRETSKVIENIYTVCIKCCLLLFLLEANYKLFATQYQSFLKPLLIDYHLVRNSNISSQ